MGSETGPPPGGPTARPSVPGSGLLRWLRSHPIVCLALLTPGLPEYLSTSSPLLALALNPAYFFLGAAINVAQYTAGALLVREALIRWGKGWVSGGLLAVAYGITEEGLGDNTLFRSSHGADGVLGHFGRFLGVNWLWSCGVLTYHVVFSIGLPIVLLGLAVPEVRGRSLIGRRGVAVGFAALSAATLVESVLVLKLYGFWMGLPLFAGAVTVIGALSLAAYFLPAHLGRGSRPGHEPGSFAWGAVGFLLFPVLFAIEYGPASVPAAAPLAFVAELAVLAGLVLRFGSRLGNPGSDHARACLSLGLVGFLAIFGLLASFPVPYTLPLAILALLFVHLIEKRYRPGPAPVEGGDEGRSGPTR